MAVVCLIASKKIFIIPYQWKYTGSFNYTISVGVHGNDDWKKRDF